MRARIPFTCAILLMLCLLSSGCSQREPDGLREEPVLQGHDSLDGQQGERTRIKMH